MQRIAGPPLEDRTRGVHRRRHRLRRRRRRHYKSNVRFLTTLAANARTQVAVNVGAGKRKAEGSARPVVNVELLRLAGGGNRISF